jgi:protein lifeguard
MSLYIIYDTQLIVGNKQNKLEIDDYIFAAMALYIDIVRLFIYILRILGAAKR